MAEAQLQTKNAVSDFKLFLYMQLQTNPGNFCGDKSRSTTGRNPFSKHTVAIAEVVVSKKEKDPQKILFRMMNDGDGGSHAEKKLLTEITTYLENVDESFEVSITFYQNYSPCRKCAYLLKEFFEKQKSGYKKLNWKIVFVAFYYIIRPSERNYDKSERLKRDSPGNIAGLQELHKSGVELRTFEKKDWKVLHGYLHFKIDGIPDRESKENYLGFVPDEINPDHLRRIVGLDADADLDLSTGDMDLAAVREKEDEFMKSDLAKILGMARAEEEGENMNKDLRTDVTEELASGMAQVEISEGAATQQNPGDRNDKCCTCPIHSTCRTTACPCNAGNKPCGRDGPICQSLKCENR